MPVGRIGQDFIVNTEFLSLQRAPSSTTLADGRFVITWDSFDNGDGSNGCTRGRVFNADGTAAGDDFIVNSTPTGTQDTISVAALADGRFVAVWSSQDLGDGSDRCIRARLFNADGNPVDLDFVVNSVADGAQTVPAATALGDDRFVVMWQSADTADGSQGCIRACVFGADGIALDSDFVVNTTAGDVQAAPTLTTLADGRVVATWTSNDTADGSGACVRARIFDTDGAPTGNDFIVNITGTGSQYLSVVAPLANGGFVAAWYSEDPGDGSMGCIRARTFDANGVPSPSDVIVNSVSADSQLDPSIAGLPDGRFVITWSSTDTGDGSMGCIRARLFQADGSATGSDFIVNTSVTNDQLVPSVTALADGRFVVSWESNDGGEGGSITSGSCIRAQIFDANTFVGTVGEDIWRGSDVFGDTINGGGSADALSGLGGDDLISGDAGSDALAGGAGNDRLFGGADNDTLDGGTGADRLFGGVGNDIVLIGSAADFAGDTINGGTETDRIRFTSTTAGETLTLTNTVTLVEIAEISDAAGSVAGTTALNLSAAAVTTGMTLIGNNGANTITGTARGDTLNGNGGIDTLNAGAGIDMLNGGAGNDVLNGGSESDTLNGGSENDVLIGGSGDDVLNAGSGNDELMGASGTDTLIGGSGPDRFVFSSGLGPTNIDTIQGFNHTDDVILLDDDIFTQAGPVGALSAGFFRAGTAAQDANDRIIFDAATGALSYDADGIGGVAQVQFATVTGIVGGLTTADFAVIA